MNLTPILNHAFLKLVILGATAFSMAACSKPADAIGKDGKGDGKTGSVQAASSSLAAISEFLQSKEQSAVLSSRSLAIAMISSNFDDGELQKTQKSERLRMRLAQASCYQQIPQQHACNSNPGQRKNPSCTIYDMNLIIACKNCPLSAQLKVNTSGSSSNLEAKITFQVQVLDPALQNELDLKSAEIAVQVHVESSDTNGQMSLRAELQGRGEGMSYGEFTLNLKQEAHMSKEGMRLYDLQTYAFNGVLTEMSAAIEQGQSGTHEEFKVNGANVSLEVYQKTAAALQLPGMIVAGKSNGGDNTDPVEPQQLDCKVEVFDARNISLAQLDRYLNFHDRLPVAPLTSVGTCERQIYLPGVVLVKIDFSENSVNIAVQDRNGQKIHNLPRGREHRQAYSSISREFNYGVSCKPVFNCR